MDIRNLYHWQENPHLLNKETLVELEQLLKEYSYSENIRLLYALNLLITNDYRFQKALVFAAVFSSNRKTLKYWVESLNKISQEEELKTEITAIELEDQKNPTLKENTAKSAIDIEQGTENQQDITYKAQQQQKAIKSKSELLKLVKKRLSEIDSEKKKQELLTDEHKQGADKQAKTKLIDQFIQNQPSISRPDKTDFFDPQNEAVNSTIDEDDFFITETLAQIHADQGNKKKALEIYRKLILRNPKKSSYFASRIEELNKE
ncbi:MAG: hypothetical protein B7C24_01740 [Bacteroidetes bacterium 4572_77]|nr:MAG: hypothetical protein B7C24_01740 [Bacteroidetes bacterium 4572_77]